MLPQYQSIVEKHEPFIVASDAVLAAIDRAPLGRRLLPDSMFSCTRTKSGPFLDLIQHLDSRCYAPLEMRMPRWALYDCGELPGAIFGIGKEAAELAPEVKTILEVPEDYSGLVPLTMYVAIPTLEEGHWLGHTLCAISEMVEGSCPAGSREVTLALALASLPIQSTTATTQWSSTKLDVHTRFGPVEALAAYVPFHDRGETCVIRSDVDVKKIEHALGVPPYQPSDDEVDLWLLDDDQNAIKALQTELESGTTVHILSEGLVEHGRRNIPLKLENGR